MNWVRILKWVFWIHQSLEERIWHFIFFTNVWNVTKLVIRTLARIHTGTRTHAHTHTHTRAHTHTLFLLGGLGTGDTLHMSQQEKLPLWIQSPEETFRVWIHGSRLSVPVPYYKQLKQTLPVPEIEVRVFFNQFCNIWYKGLVTSKSNNLSRAVALDTARTVGGFYITTYKVHLGCLWV